MGVKIQVESYEQARPGVELLLEEHWREVALYQDEIKLAPDFERYESLYAAGKLIIVTARLAEVLIGYSIFILHNHIHYKNCLVASQDVLFVTGTQRKTGAGIRLIRGSEDVLRKLGVNRITHHCKQINNLQEILTALGYLVEEVIVGKLIQVEQHGI